jgi:hypothetical protein
MHALGARHFASVALPRRWTTPSRAGAEQLQRRAQELLARQPDAQLPPELQRIADILGITLPPAANLWRVFVPAFASSGGEGLLVCARRWLEVVPRDSSARTTRCQHLLDVVLPTVHSRLDERLALEARANSERLSLDALQRYDPAADRATHEPVTQHFVEGVILGGRPQLSSAETAKAFRAADTSYAALCSSRCPLWHSAVGAIVMLVMYSYTRSWAAMAVVAALQYGAPSVSWLHDLVAKGRVPSAQAEADMLRVYILQAIVFINDNVGHYKKMVSYSAGLSATVLVHCARLVAVVHGYTNGVQHMPHLVPALWPEAAVACPAEYTAAEEKARMIAHMEAELHAALETVITEERVVNAGLEEGEVLRDPVSKAVHTSVPGAMECSNASCNAYYPKPGNRKKCSNCSAPLQLFDPAARAVAAHAAAPAGLDAEGDATMRDAADAPPAPAAPARNACKTARRADPEVLSDGRVAFTHRKLRGCAAAVLSFLNPGKEMLIGATERRRNVTVVPLACTEPNPATEVAQKEFLDRVVETSGLKDGTRSSVVVSGDMGTGRMMRKILRACTNPFFACIVFLHGLLHEHMHMIKAWRQLAGPLTTRDFAPHFGRAKEQSKENLAGGKLTHHASFHAFKVENKGVVLELAHMYLHRPGAPPIASATADGAAFLAWLQVEAAARDERFNYVYLVHVLYACAIRLFHGGIRENDGLAVRAARAAFAPAFAAMGKFIYAEEVAFAMVLYKRAPKEWQQFFDDTVGLSEDGVIAGQAQPFDSLMEQSVRHLNRLVSTAGGYRQYLFASLNLAAMTAIRRVARDIMGLYEYVRTPRSLVDTSAPLHAWRVELRSRRYLQGLLAAAPPRPLASVSGVPLAANAATVFAAGEQAFRDLYSAAMRGESEEWKMPRRVEVDAALEKAQAEKEAKREAELAALAARTTTENAKELLEMRELNERLRAQNGALLARAAGGDAEERSDDEDAADAADDE